MGEDREAGRGGNRAGTGVGVGVVLRFQGRAQGQICPAGTLQGQVQEKLWRQVDGGGRRGRSRGNS